MKSILIIGATGNIGRQVIAHLVNTDARVRALTRNTDSAKLPATVEVAGGDLAIPDSLDACLDGMDTVFMVWTPKVAFAPVLEKITKYARRIVFLSAPIRTAHPFFQQPNPLSERYAEMELQIENSGLGWTYLRPGMFAGNALLWWAKQIYEEDVVRWPYLNAPTAPVDERDIGAVAAHVLCDDKYVGADYVLTGPQSLTQSKQIAIIGQVIGRPLRIEEMSPEEARIQWQHSPAADMLLNAWAAAIGQPAFITTAVEDITGVPACTFFDWVKDHAVEFVKKNG